MIIDCSTSKNRLRASRFAI